ncbi:hypothetical protein B0I35DRAFT_476913 [Stachybotrys elegans]|uniref:Uncharacterized protein n=1 Tax=Stachybotrys elegans TaxID=80388 RepID=A0A8K0SW55_9HYPO|nr:hypothetical protein B0I35DRAFT_476913 [Stachybotrys elegans]
MSDAKATNSHSVFERILQLVQTLALTGILVVLAMLLVEVRRFTSDDHGVAIRIANSEGLPVRMVFGGTGSSSQNPFYISSVGLGNSFDPLWIRVDQIRPTDIAKMTALFKFESLILVLLLAICTSAYVHQIFPRILDSNKTGFFGIMWKFARIGERLSPYISIACVVMATRLLLGMDQS